eukprot:TRINITY_DN98527_c0_g1_i1.p1 TRINITY_DN98527_c0_g1~~TRINITY_DN98527_c0_g1_i1.p1  ORF type:complete len:111 (+),score=18.61 TRINITY_DN98527_c0_g1_i1:66-398(+)
MASADTRSMREFTLQTLGGERFEIKVPSDGNVGDLEAEASKTRELGLCFSLIVDGQLLSDLSACLPQENEIHCQIENISGLPEAAQEILRKAPERRKIRQMNLAFGDAES